MLKFSRQLLMFFTLLAVALIGRQAAADDTFAAATQLYQASQWQLAAAAFDRIAQSSQNNEATRLAAQLYAGESLVQLGKYAEARQRYQLVRNPSSSSQPPAPLAAQALFRLGEAAWLSGEIDEAAKLLQAYVAKHPTGASTSFAQTYLQQIREQQSSQVNFDVLDEAVGWERDGRHDAALAAYRKLLQQHTRPDQVRAETLRRAAKLHDRLAQSREAIELYQQFLAEFPHSKQTVEVQSAVAWLHDRLDQPTQAAEQFRGVVAKFPQSAQAAEAAYWLALAHADKQDNNQSIEYTDWLLARKDLPKGRPKLWGKALCLKCQLLSSQSEWQQIDKLVETTEGRLDDGPLNTKLEFWAAEAAFRQRQYKTARERFTTLQPKTIGINQSWTAMIPLRRAQLAARRQQWSAVLKILDQLERDHPDFELDYEVDYLRGRAMAGRGNMTAARKFYGRVLDNRAAADTEAATMAGWMTGETFFHQHDYARARAAYQTVMKQTTFTDWQSRAALQAGKCWELEQHWDEAAEVYTAALKRWPDSDSDTQLESRLRWAQSQAIQQR